MTIPFATEKPARFDVTIARLPMTVACITVTIARPALWPCVFGRDDREWKFLPIPPRRGLDDDDRVLGRDDRVLADDDPRASW